MIPHTPIRPPQSLARSLVVGSDEGLFLVVVENDDLVRGQRRRSPGSTFPVGGIRFQLLAPQQLALQVKLPQPEVPNVNVDCLAVGDWCLGGKASLAMASARRMPAVELILSVDRA